MANSVSVDIETVEVGREICEEFKNQLDHGISSIIEQYENMRTSWNDEKYEDLGVIIESCTETLESVSDDIETLKEQLDTLIQAITEYNHTEI